MPGAGWADMGFPEGGGGVCARCMCIVERSKEFCCRTNVKYLAVL